jgi:protein-tyrosine phosphatase
VAGFLDIHSHMVPSGDDGVQSEAEGLMLLRETAARGTTVQYATPHANRNQPWTPRRDLRVRGAMARMAEEAAEFGLDFRLGWEVSPQPWFLDVDPATVALEGLAAALIEFPLPHVRERDLELLQRCCDHIESAGLTPVLAHPERCRTVHDDLRAVEPFAERGWPLQVNASSILRRENDRNWRAGWWLIEEGLCDLVGSDGHRATRPPYLDEAHAAVARRVGRETADRLLGGEALERLAVAPGAR